MNSMLEQIREKYPMPIRALSDARTQESYCVGGALCLFIGGAVMFPRKDSLAKVLRSVNSNLDECAAQVYANTITSENDAGHFDAAWEALGLALSYGEA